MEIAWRLILGDQLKSGGASWRTHAAFHFSIRPLHEAGGFSTRGTQLMRRAGIVVTVAVCLVALIGGAIAWLKINYPTFSYRYRLTLSIEIDGKVDTGASIIEIIWKGGPEFGDVGPYHPIVRGQAVFIDLGSRG